MDKPTRDRLLLAAIGVGTGAILMLEGAGLIGTASSGDAPRWLLSAAGLGFSTAGAMAALNTPGKWNDLMASIVTGALGVIFGWVSLFGDPSHARGNGLILEHLTGIPLTKIVFGLGSLVILSVSGYAFISFWRKLFSQINSTHAD